MIVHRVLIKLPCLYAYTLKIVQGITPHDMAASKEFAMNITEKVDEDKEFLSKIFLYDKTTFHASGKVNRKYTSRDKRNLMPERSTLTNNPKVNVWSGLRHDGLIGTFLFAEATVTSSRYRDVPENITYP